MGYMLDEGALDKLSRVITEVLKQAEEVNSSRMVLNTGKKRVINYLESVWKSNGLSKEQLDKNIAEANSNLEEGWYTIDSHSIQNLGVKFHGNNL